MNDELFLLEVGKIVKIQYPISKNVIIGIIKSFHSNNFNTYMELGEAVLIEYNDITNYWFSEKVMVSIDEVKIQIPDSVEKNIFYNYNYNYSPVGKK